MVIQTDQVNCRVGQIKELNTLRRLRFSIVIKCDDGSLMQLQTYWLYRTNAKDEWDNVTRYLRGSCEG